MQVDVIGLWGFEIDDAVDVFDIETSRGEVGGQEVVYCAVTEGFDGFNTLVEG